MGQQTDAAIAAWQNEAGIEPAAGARLDALQRLSRLAYDLIRVVELERSGIRDGDGFWHGSDPLGGLVDEIHAQGQVVRPALTGTPQPPTLEAGDNGLPF